MIFHSHDLNPVSIAKRDAERTFADPDAIQSTEIRDETLASLEEKAAALGFIDTAYRLKVRRAVSAFADPEKAAGAPSYNFFSLEFMGKMLCYAKARFQVVEQTLQMDGLCLNFYETYLLPDADTLPKGHVLYVPVMAVEDIVPIPY